MQWGCLAARCLKDLPLKKHSEFIRGINLFATLQMRSKKESLLDFSCEEVTEGSSIDLFYDCVCYITISCLSSRILLYLYKIEIPHFIERLFQNRVNP